LKHRIVIVSPDPNTDYCYLDMTREAALAKFHQHEDWLNIYQPKGIMPATTELEFDDSFMLWRNKGSDLADILGQRGGPEWAQDLLRGGPKTPQT